MPGDLMDIYTNLEDQYILVEGWKPTQRPAPQLEERKSST